MPAPVNSAAARFKCERCHQTTTSTGFHPGACSACGGLLHPDRPVTLAPPVPLPAIIVIHHWNGSQTNTRTVSRDDVEFTARGIVTPYNGGQRTYTWDEITRVEAE